jgi:hypothetical protein
MLTRHFGRNLSCGRGCHNSTLWREGMGRFRLPDAKAVSPKVGRGFFAHPYLRRTESESYHLFQLFFTLCKSYLDLYCNIWKWMAGASRGHAALSFLSPQPSEMGDATRGPRRRFDEPIPQTSKMVRGPGDVKPELDKRSLDYILRSGLAGGLAGCAVWRKPPRPLPSC